MQLLFLKSREERGRRSYFAGLISLIGLISLMSLLNSCNTTNGKTVEQSPPAPPALPVLELAGKPGVTFQDFSASLQGRSDIEIRPQVDGYIDKIYVDEGARVKKGQLLFGINSLPYKERLNNAIASVALAKANVATADINVQKLQPLVQGNVVSDVQLKTAQASKAAAEASLSQAQAMLRQAEISLGYTAVKAPVDGYIGRIPFKTGSLVGVGEALPLTVLSDVSEVYAYFSMSEPDFIAFKNKFSGNTIEEKVKQVPPVELVLADNSIFGQKGKIGTIEGQFDKTTGSISFRAVFPNTAGTLRSGNTGKIRIPQLFESALIVPQEATFEIQDKVFVFTVADSNKVISKPIRIIGKTSNYYYVDNGVQQGEKIVLSGIGNLRDGAVITPQLVSVDSLLKVKSL